MDCEDKERITQQKFHSWALFEAGPEWNFGLSYQAVLLLDQLGLHQASMKPFEIRRWNQWVFLWHELLFNI